ncbi:RIB43A-domain-containing protein [Blyttiomyces helicus]|uniref:RIB43A-domain-containing protein n=1 Tax=Blyttiomyces helicus TaxID=388810 RepID=A0A4P9W3D2_9FUNG|nr:RIB43A-domain-containing protein [Blyttiomyces helicus]|eukprot:RKO86312.1 RIB43A-domain-containing protein [Blyttiomyces helicus]
MYKVEIQADNLRDAAIRRRRALDEERKKRIFDPKIRILGIDVAALEEQIKIKNDSKEIERQREENLDRAAKHTNTLLQHLDAAAEAEARSHLQSINEFRTKFQQPWQRRDYDLYDPHALKKATPMRIGDDDERCGISGCQRFEGEDLSFAERKQLQKQQMSTWVREGVWEKRVKRKQELDEEMRYEQFQREVSMKTMALQNAVHEAKYNQALEDRETNRQMAELKRKKEAADRQFELEKNAKEIEGHLNGEFLTETPDVFNIGGGHQVRVDIFKGITPEQKTYILNMQEQQRAEAEALRQKKRQEEQEWALQEAANLRAATLLQREKDRQSKDMAVQLREENSRKAQEDRLRQMYTDKILYTNPPTEEYFNQFNTTSR